MKHQTGTQHHGRVRIVPAGMHHARHGALEGKIVQLLDGQGVQVGAQGHFAATPLPSFQRGDEPGAGHAFAHLDACLTQPAGHVGRRVVFLERKLGMGMQVAAYGQHLVLHLARALPDLLDHRLRMSLSAPMSMMKPNTRRTTTSGSTSAHLDPKYPPATKAAAMISA